MLLKTIIIEIFLLWVSIKISGITTEFLDIIMRDLYFRLTKTFINLKPINQTSSFDYITDKISTITYLTLIYFNNWNLLYLYNFMIEIINGKIYI